MVTVAILSSSSDASAQLIFDGDQYRSSDDPLRDERLISIRERPQPTFEPRGVAVGKSLFRPELNVKSTWNTNLLAETREPLGDLVLNITPSLFLQLRGEENRARLSAHISLNRHARRTLEDNEEYGASFDTRLGLAKGYSLLFVGGVGRFIETRTDRLAPANSLRPIRFDRTHVRALGLKSASRFVARAGVELERLDYHNGVDRYDPASIIFESRRSRSEYRPFLQAEYSFSPDTTLFAGAHFNRKDFHKPFPASLPSRDSNGFELSGGMRFKPTPLIKIAAALGYLEQYHSRPFADVKGLSAEAQLKWLPTMLTSAHVQFSRKIEEGGSQFPGSSFVNELEIGADHELLRNLILGFAGGYQDYRFAGQDRRNRRIFFSVAADYRPNRNMAIQLEYSGLDQNSSERRPGLDFNQHRFSLTMTLAV